MSPKCTNTQQQPSTEWCIASECLDTLAEMMCTHVQHERNFHLVNAIQSHSFSRYHCFEKCVSVLVEKQYPDTWPVCVWSIMEVYAFISLNRWYCCHGYCSANILIIPDSIHSNNELCVWMCYDICVSIKNPNWIVCMQLRSYAWHIARIVNALTHQNIDIHRFYGIFPAYLMDGHPVLCW